MAEKSKNSLSFVNRVTGYLIDSTLFCFKMLQFSGSGGDKARKEKILELEKSTEVDFRLNFH